MFNKELKDEIKRLSSQFEIIHNDLSEAKSELKIKENEIDSLKLEVESKNNFAQKELSKLDNIIKVKEKEISELDKNIISLNNTHTLELSGYYEDITLSAKQYRQELNINMNLQNKMVIDKEHFIKKKEVFIDTKEYSGDLFIKNITDRYVKSFRLSIEKFINSLKISNVDYIKEITTKEFNGMNKELDIFGIYLTQTFFNLKLAEIDIRHKELVAEYKELEAEDKRKEILREEIRVERDIRDEKDKLSRELLKLYSRQEQGNNLKSEILELQRKIENNDYALTNNKSGWLYIISNPSFGKNVYKIGVTRQDNIEDRLKELNNTNVPFAYSLNCLIWSNDCFKLESELHREFAEYKINKCKPKKELFKIQLEEIERVLREKYNIEEKFNYNIIDADFIECGYEIGDNFNVYVGNK